MRIGAVVVRRFVERGARADRVVDARRAVELPFPPTPGMILSFGDGTGECVVSKVRLRVEPPARLGIIPTEVELIGCHEPVAGLEAALAAGWVTETPPPPPAAV